MYPLKTLFCLLSLLIGMTTTSTPLPTVSTPFNIALGSAMSSMHIAMAQVRPTGKLDMDFAAMMIPHHAGAIEMAKVELKYGTDPRLRRLAQEIIVTQNAEIDFMHLVLNRLAPPADSISK